MSEWRYERGRARGFTLVELLVAILVTALVSIAIFALFNTTSSALREADSLVESVDTARFALEQVRSDIKQASAFGTPDSAFDPDVRPEPGGTFATSNYRVAGLVSYNGWQDYADEVMPAEVRDQAEFQDADGNLLPNFDGIVLIGAQDYPFTFEVGDIRSQSLIVYDHPRGLDKLARNNLMELGNLEEAFDGSDPAEVLDQNGRILRVRDSGGYNQYFGIEGFEENGADLQINLTNTVFFRPTEAQDLKFGFPPRTQQSHGERYRASLLDVYWYRVRQDPTDELNFQLVRQRLSDGWEVARQLDSWADFDPANYTDQTEPTVVADRVVDFQVWFDCTQNNEGTIVEADWLAGWRPPDGTTDPAHDCLDPPDGSGGGTKPQSVNARFAHVRLSVRTEEERAELTKEAFPDPGPVANHRTLQTFDLRPDNEGKTRVYTVQSDFELMNYAVRNLKAGIAGN